MREREVGVGGGGEYVCLSVFESELCLLYV